MAVKESLVLIPSRAAVRVLAADFGLASVVLEPRPMTGEGVADFMNGRRRAFICAKKTNLESPALEPWSSE
jgi:hypothetical protein